MGDGLDGAGIKRFIQLLRGGGRDGKRLLAVACAHEGDGRENVL